MRRVSDLNIALEHPAARAALMLHEIPRSDSQEEFVAESRRQIREILVHTDRRLLLIVGPCSLHDTRAGLEYAKRSARPDRPCRRAAAAGHALLLRKTADFRRLEGPDHGPAPRRVGRHSRGAENRPANPPRYYRNGRADGHGAVGPDYAAVHRRPDLLVGDWRPHDGIADAPPDGVGTLHAAGVQETRRWDR